MREKERMRHVNILLHAEAFVFGKDSLKVTDVHKEEYEIPYGEIVLVYIASCGEDGICAPELSDITEDTDGTIVICNSQQNRFEIRADLAEHAAGEVFKSLTEYAPHALFGSQPWLNEYDAGQFEEVLEMVDIMKECVK